MGSHSCSGWSRTPDLSDPPASASQCWDYRREPPRPAYSSTYYVPLLRFCCLVFVAAKMFGASMFSSMSYLVHFVFYSYFIGFSLLSSNIGSGHFIGLAAVGASSGIAIGTFEWNAVFLLCFLGWIFVPVYIKAEVVMVSDYLRKRFGTHRIQIIFSVLYLFLYIFNRIALEVCSYALFMRMLWGMDIYLIILVLLTVSGLYTITGGLVAVVYTGVLHVFIMLLGSVLLMCYGK
uniref:Uncharacterized protein n=1 Tax=Prolemur simus TaxID=1328070 RepID=A0A8C8ZFK6_PROSS